MLQWSGNNSNSSQNGESSRFLSPHEGSSQHRYQSVTPKSQRSNHMVQRATMVRSPMSANSLTSPVSAVSISSYGLNSPCSPLSSPGCSPGGKSRKVRKRVKNACTNCKVAKTRCDMQRPCGRCKRRGQEACCVDTVHKRRGRKRSLEDLFMQLSTQSGNNSPVSPHPRGEWSAKSPSSHRNNVVMAARVPDSPHEPDSPCSPKYTKTESRRAPTGNMLPYSTAYEESLLVLFNKQLEKWSFKLRSVPSSRMASQWLSTCLCSHLQQEDNGEVSHEKSRFQARKSAFLANKLQASGFDDDTVVFESLPLGVMMFSLDPIPFHPANRVHLNQAAMELLGYSRAEVEMMNRSKTALSMLYHISNLEQATEKFMDAIVENKQSYSVRSKWVHKNGHFLDLMEVIWIKYDSGVPLYLISWLQDAENSVDISSAVRGYVSHQASRSIHKSGSANSFESKMADATPVMATQVESPSVATAVGLDSEESALDMPFKTPPMLSNHPASHPSPFGNSQNSDAMSHVSDSDHTFSLTSSPAPNCFADSTNDSPLPQLNEFLSIPTGGDMTEDTSLAMKFETNEFSFGQPFGDFDLGLDNMFVDAPSATGKSEDCHPMADNPFSGFGDFNTLPDFADSMFN